MNILYVKNNSERKKEFQLKTIIYEKNGFKFVRKEASCYEAIPHLKKMKKNYQMILDSILTPKIKPAKIIEETKNSLTFEFIEGISLEKKIYSALKSNDILLMNKTIDTYIKILSNGFKTTQFSIKDNENTSFKKYFGVLAPNSFINEISFDNTSNIDLIFSNIIQKEDTFYLIDYEWVFDFSIPLSFMIFRQFDNLDFPDKLRREVYKKYKIMPKKKILTSMNSNFIMKYVTDKYSFYQYAIQYKKPEIHYLDVIETEKQTAKGHAENLFYARSIVEQRDAQIESMRIKRRIKQFIKQFIPAKLLLTMGYTPLKKNNTENISSQYSYVSPCLDTIIRKRLSTFHYQPLISIIMPVYNVSPKWLKLAINSVEAQWYENWELCIADDKSTNQDTIQFLKSINHPKIKITFLKDNLNIAGASNKAISLSTGEYIALMDNDDEITVDALFEILKSINGKNADFIYSDEDFMTIKGECVNPHFKPDFSPDLLLSHNYITHFSCFKKSLLDEVGYFNSEFDGAQDYDLFLRLTEKAKNICHIPKVLYHWRMIETSTSVNSDIKPEALERGKKVLESTLERRSISASIKHGNLHHYFRVQYNIKNTPLISIIMPFKDKPELLDMSINSILEKSTYQNFEIIGISNNSEEKNTFAMMKTLEEKDSRVKFYKYDVDFNYAEINNYAIDTYSKGEYVILLNNDIEIISHDWIESMLEHAQKDSVGCVGTKLYYPNNTVQHAGIIIGLGGYAGHSHKYYQRDNPGYFNRLNVIQNVSAVTAACLMIQKDKYNEVHGMDEVNFKVAYNDVDFCLRIREAGYLNIFTPYAEMYHHESITRGYETTPEKMSRFKIERNNLGKRHHDVIINGDPYYNPNLTHDKEDFSLCLK